jgi:DNA mismatch repair ATPase MutS
VISRARQILKNLERGELDPQGLPVLAKEAGEVADGPGQLSFALGAPAPRPPEEEEVLDALREFDPDATTPMDALAKLAALRARLEPGDQS